MPRKKTPTKEEIQKKKKLTRDNAWKKENCTAITIRFRNERDSDIIAKLKETPNKVEYLCNLIRQDIKK